MYAKSIELVNYRNYKKARIDFAEGFNVLYGNNAQGKTNIIEAIFLCALGRSHRTSKDVELVKIGEEGYRVEIILSKGSGQIKEEIKIEISYEKNSKKTIRINEIPLRRIGELVGRINAVIFSPEDIMLVKEGPAERRRFVDITLSQLKPCYFYDLQQYIRILIQRNMLLKEIRYKKSLIDTMEIWNVKLAKIGARIMAERREFIKRLSDAAKVNHKKLTGGNEEIEIIYAPSIEVGEGQGTEDIEKEFLNAIERLFEKELMRSTTLVGPQRDDYDILVNGMNIKMYGSQGQQRTAILSLKLSETEIIKEEKDEYPVLLLDDVMSELDRKRQEYLFENLDEIQTFITCTDKSFFENVSKAKAGCKFFVVKEGNISEYV